MLDQSDLKSKLVLNIPLLKSMEACYSRHQRSEVKALFDGEENFPFFRFETNLRFKLAVDLKRLNCYLRSVSTN